MSVKNSFGKILLAIFAVCWLAVPVFAQKRQIRVASAADLQTVMPQIAKAYETRSGTSVEVVYGSSGNFYAQIQNGAPLDVFLSADSEYREGWKCLVNPDVRKIAIANPEHAPYGRAAVAALRKAGIYDEIRAKLVFGENISQAAQFVESGNAQAAILAYSLTSSPGLRGGKKWEIPKETYPRIVQAVVVLKSSKDKISAQDFVKFVTKGQGRELLAKFGFQPPVDHPSAQ